MSPPSRRPHGDEPGAPVYGQRLSRFEQESLRAPGQLEKVAHPAGAAADLNDVAPQNSGRRDLDVGYQRTPEGPVTHRFTAGRVELSGAVWQGQAHVS